MIQLRVEHGDVVAVSDPFPPHEFPADLSIAPAPALTGSGRSSSINKRRSRRQEEDIAKGCGGKRVRGSGAVPGLKGDVRVSGRYRIEAKLRSGDSYRVTKTDLDKIWGECSGDEVPVFVVEFRDVSRIGARWALLPWPEFERLQCLDE